MTANNNDDNDSDEYLDAETRRLLAQRKKQKKTYKRQDAEKKPGINGETWRRPRGTHSSLRLQKNGQPVTPGVGQRSPKQVRGLHPSGREEIHVANRKELEDVVEQSKDGQLVAVRLSSRLSQRKKKQFIEHAHTEGVPVLNIPQQLKQDITPLENSEP